MISSGGCTCGSRCCDKPRSSVQFVFRHWVHSRLLLIEAARFWKWKVHLKPPYEAAFLTNPEEICTARPSDLPRRGRKNRRTKGERSWVKESFISLVFTHSAYTVKKKIKKGLSCFSQQYMLFHVSTNNKILSKGLDTVFEAPNIVFQAALPGRH